VEFLPYQHPSIEIRFLNLKNKVMETEKILISDLVDLVFDNRNKKYGAYQLRKKYPITLFRSIIIVFSTVSALLFLIIGNGNAENPKVFDIEDTRMVELSKKTTVNQPKQKRNKVPKTGIRQSSKRPQGSKIIMVDSTSEVKDSIEKWNPIGITSGVGNNFAMGFGGGGSDEDSAMVDQSSVDSTDTEVGFEELDFKPSFPGGIAGLNRFLRENLVYPDEAIEDEMMTVMVRFVVGYDGKLHDLVILKDGGKLFNEEVIRVIKKMPVWVPGKSNGKNVSVFYNLPVHFLKEQ
jgi:protein TonB